MSRICAGGFCSRLGCWPSIVWARTLARRGSIESGWNRFGSDVAGTLLGVLDLFSGGNFRTISIFALGVTPYITASIILQLMTVVSPQLKKLQEEGEMGRQKINQWTRYLTVGLAAIQTSFVAHWLQVNGVGAPTWGFLLTTMLTLDYRNDLCDVAWGADY